MDCGGGFSWTSSREDFGLRTEDVGMIMVLGGT
jgi:hypothetical protein